MEQTRTGPAGTRWRDALRAWALPRSLLDAAPEDPYRVPVELLTTPVVDPLQTPTGRVVVRLVGRGGTLLDVGCGAGRFAAAFVGEGVTVTGVEPKPQLAERSRSAGIDVVQARWPEAADGVPVASVVTSTHVLYDVAEAAPFVAALHRQARTAVVLELTAAHPWVPLRGLYRRFHALDRPTGPTSDDALDVVHEVLGVRPRVERTQRAAGRYPSLDALVAHRRRQLCLRRDDDGALLDALDGAYDVEADGTVRTAPVEVATIWWSTR